MKKKSYFTLRINFEESDYENIRHVLESLKINSFEEGESRVNENGDLELINEYSLITIRDLNKDNIIKTASIFKEYFPSVTITLNENNDNYLDEWKQFATPIQLTPNIFIRPSWIEKNLIQESGREIILDPGYAFGSGSHPTTILCSREIEKLGMQSKPKSLLDVGCGSGILCIVASLLGFEKIVGIDIDPLAIESSKDNAKKNNCKNIEFSITPIEEIKEQYDVIVANIISSVLFEIKNSILTSLKPDGVIILSGILSEEIVKVAKEFGFASYHKDILEEWGVLVFKAA